MTWVTFSTSMPRAATSVATSVSMSPEVKRASAFSRWPCVLSPCMETAGRVRGLRGLTSRAAPRLARARVFWPCHEPVRPALGADEDEGAAAVAVAQLALERLELGLVVHGDEA